MNLFLIRKNSSLLNKINFEDYSLSEFDNYEIKLRKNYPNVTRNENILCGFLMNNYSTKEISLITNKSINAIEVARTRLRNKIGINNKKMTIQNYILNSLN